MQNIIDSVQYSKNLQRKLDQIEDFQKCLCLTCKVETKHEILVKIIKHIIYEHKYLRFYESYQLIKCINCDDISFYKEKWNPDDIVIKGEDIYGNSILDVSSQVNIYPLRDLETAFSKEFKKILPEEIYLTYEEVIVAINNNMPLLTALGLRTLLEQIIKYFGKTDNLGVILIQFEEEGFISTKQKGLLDNIRFLGNDAAHRANSKSRTDLILYLKVLENLIHQLFVYYRTKEKSVEKMMQCVDLKPSPKYPIPIVRETTRKRKPKKKL